MVSIVLAKLNYNKVINLPLNYGERFSDLSLKKKTLIKQVKLRSSAFNNQEKIPKKYRFDYGDNINPPFSIHKTPAKTKSLVLIIEDLDHPNICINWILWNIPAKTNEIREGETLVSGEFRRSAPPPQPPGLLRCAQNPQDLAGALAYI